MTRPFSKYEGLGNDFIVFDAPDEQPLSLSCREIVALCDRHTGVGADGVLVLGTRGGVPVLRIFNADGSAPEMCGNGLRCAAWHWVRTARITRTTFEVNTPAGPHRCAVAGAGRTAVVSVEMRPAGYEPLEVPIVASGPVIDAIWSVAGRSLRVTALSVGNPHVVVFESATQDERARLGPALQSDVRFPQGVNVGFAEIDDRKRIVLHVLERGAGWTRACGTGACAAAAAAVRTGRLPASGAIEVILPGGSLVVEPARAPGGSVRMCGPARHVFDAVLADPK